MWLGLCKWPLHQLWSKRNQRLKVKVERSILGEKANKGAGAWDTATVYIKSIHSHTLSQCLSCIVTVNIRPDVFIHRQSAQKKGSCEVKFNNTPGLGTPSNNTLFFIMCWVGGNLNEAREEKNELCPSSVYHQCLILASAVTNNKKDVLSGDILNRVAIVKKEHNLRDY